MEISPDLLFINGILISAKAEYGDMSEIIYHGFAGENVVYYIEKSLRSLLNEKNYYDDEMPKIKYSKYFEDLSLFLLVNCNFSKPFKLEEYEHLTCNVPKLSKYLVTKIIVEMNLVTYFCIALKKLPLMYSCEMFSQFLPILDKVETTQLLEDTHCLLLTIANISIKHEEFKYTDEMDILQRDIPDFFFKITRLSVEDATKLKKKELYERVGNVMKKLFSLLFFCHKNEIFEGILITKLIYSTTIIVRAVTLDMFVYWAEIELPSGETLQSHLSASAYLLNVKYQNHKPASNMVECLKPIAIKPKDIKEQIASSDMNQIIHMISKADDNQKKWFQALVFSSYVSNTKGMDCISKWSELCDSEDVSRLLNHSVKENNIELKKIAVKCASKLNLEELIVVVIRHFYNNGFVVMKDNPQNIIQWFNKLKDSESLTKNNNQELLIFILENPDFSINFVLTECIKSEFYISSLHDCFTKLKNVFKIHDICLNYLNKLMIKTPPNAETYQAYTTLVQTFFAVDLITFEVFSERIICPLLTEYSKQKDYEKIYQLLVILNNLELIISVEDGTKVFFDILFEILSKRTGFIDHSAVLKNVIQEVVHFITNKTVPNPENEPSFFKIHEESLWLNFYKCYLCSPTERTTFAQHVMKNIDVVDGTAALCLFMNILPHCVQDEWVSICTDVSEKIGFSKFIQSLCDLIISLCDFTKNRANKDNFLQLSEALKYNIHQFGYVLKIKFLPLNNEENEILITQSLVNVMSHFPDNLKESEGMNIINSLISTRSLKRLGNDPNFVENICQIKNTTLCQLIASKILQ